MIQATIEDINSQSQWEEELEVGSIKTAKEDIKQILKLFNEEEIKRYGKKARLRAFVSINTEILIQNIHNWEKVSAFCDQYGRVVYKCSRCKLVEKIPHYSLRQPSRKKCYPERVCTLCNKQFASEKSLKRHKTKKHL